MSSKSEKLLKEFYNICLSSNEQNPSFEVQFKAKTAQLREPNNQTIQGKINWKDQILEAYEHIKNSDAQRLKTTVICQQLISQFQKKIKTKDMQLEVMANELNIVKTSLEQQKAQVQKVHKEYEKGIEQQRHKTMKALQKLEYKEYEIRQLEQKIAQYQEELQEIKSSEYQNMLNSIKEEQILNSQTQNLYKENTLLKFQLKQQNLLKNQLSRHIKTLNQQIQEWSRRYDGLRNYMEKRLATLRQNQKVISNISITRDTKLQQEQTINLIEFKDDFSFKDSIENQNNSMIIHQNMHSFLDLESGSQAYCRESPERCLVERDILNLTERDRSTHSRNITKHLLRSKKHYMADKQNVSQNTFDINDFQNFGPNQGQKVSCFGSKSQVRKDLTSNCSIDKYVPSPRGFGTQERDSFLSKHRRIKSSFCGKSIQEFHEYENNHHFFVNSQKLKEHMYVDETNQLIVEPIEENDSKNIADESSILGYDVNEIVINQELITSTKTRMQKSVEQVKEIPIIEAKMIKSMQVYQVPTAGTQNNPPVDIYYAFFSLTAQCVKLNSKNFNRAISVYFNLEEEYNNVLKKTIPINKWYNYIRDQIDTALKYIM